MSSAPPTTATLNTGATIPLVGLGCWIGKRVEGDNPETYQMVRDALDIGYRHLDTADGYGNEQAVGRAVRESGIKREEIFVTTKLNNTDHHDVKAGFEKSLKALDIEYIDLYLIHWPQAADPSTGNIIPYGESPTFVDTWKQMEEVFENDKRCKAIGVSNLSAKNLEILLKDAKVIPAVNQVESNIYLPQSSLSTLCGKNKIHLTAYAPLGRPKPDQPSAVLQDETVKHLAEKYGRPGGSVLLSWLVQRGNWSVVPKSSNPKRLKANLDIFTLSQEDFDSLSNLHKEDGKLMHSLMFGNTEDIMKAGKVFGWSLEDLGWEKMD